MSNNRLSKKFDRWWIERKSEEPKGDDDTCSHEETAPSTLKKDETACRIDCYCSGTDQKETGAHSCKKFICRSELEAFFGSMQKCSISETSLSAESDEATVQAHLTEDEKKHCFFEKSLGKFTAMSNKNKSAHNHDKMRRNLLWNCDSILKKKTVTKKTSKLPENLIKQDYPCEKDNEIKFINPNLKRLVETIKPDVVLLNELKLKYITDVELNKVCTSKFANLKEAEMYNAPEFKKILEDARSRIHQMIEKEMSNWTTTYIIKSIAPSYKKNYKKNTKDDRSMFLRGSAILIREDIKHEFTEHIVYCGKINGFEIASVRDTTLNIPIYSCYIRQDNDGHKDHEKAAEEFFPKLTEGVIGGDLNTSDRKVSKAVTPDDGELPLLNDSLLKSWTTHKRKGDRATKIDYVAKVTADSNIFVKAHKPIMPDHPRKTSAHWPIIFDVFKVDPASKMEAKSYCEDPRCEFKCEERNNKQIGWK